MLECYLKSIITNVYSAPINKGYRKYYYRDRDLNVARNLSTFNISLQDLYIW